MWFNSRASLKSSFLHGSQKSSTFPLPSGAATFAGFTPNMWHIPVATIKTPADGGVQRRHRGFEVLFAIRLDDGRFLCLRVRTPRRLLHDDLLLVGSGLLDLDACDDLASLLGRGLEHRLEVFELFLQCRNLARRVGNLLKPGVVAPLRLLHQ